MHYNKRFSTVLLAGAILTGRLFSFSAETEMYKRVYQFSTAWSERCAIVKSVIADKSEDSANNEFFDAVLVQLLSEAQNVSGATEKKAWDECAGIIAAHMGTIRNIESEDSLWALYGIAADPSVKAEILTALGQMHSQTYYGRIVNILADTNTTSGGDIDFSEKIAYGAIAALGKYGDERAYKVIFIAEHSWYSKQTRDFAAKTRSSLTASHGAQLAAIINDASVDRNIKADALAIAKRKGTELSDADKTAIALAAYKQALSYAAPDLQTKKEKQTMIETCIKILTDSRDHSPEAVPLLRESTLPANTAQERLNAVVALGINGTDSAVGILADLTDEYNRRRTEGPFGTAEETFIRTLIAALGETQNVKAREPLKSVVILNAYTNAIRNLAAKAMNRLPEQ